jgi:predicted nucleic acid-binding protein
MRYCADTWFLLGAFGKDPRATAIIEETKRGKAWLVVPIVVFAETTKKLLQKGIDQSLVDRFFAGVSASDKVELAVADKAIAQEAATISLSFNTPLIDAFVAATARLTGCHALLAADTDYAPLAKRKYLKVQSW